MHDYAVLTMHVEARYVNSVSTLARGADSLVGSISACYAGKI